MYDNKLKLTKELLLKIANSIDENNSYINPEQYEELLSTVNFMTQANVKYSKYQAINYLNISRATFDNYVADGKIPKGRKQQGFKEIFWLKSDLDKFKNGRI